MIKKIAFVTGVNSRKAGGLFFTISSLVNHLKNDEISVIGYKDSFSDEDAKNYNKDIKLLFYSLIINKFLKIGFSQDIYKILNKFSPQIIHQQGIWLYYSKVVLKYRRENKCKVVVQPHGMLDKWAIKNSSLKKKIIGFLYENQNLKESDCIHALNIQEYKAVRNYGLKNPVAIIPNGINLPENLPEKKVNSKSKKSLLYIGRIHPKKGLELLIDAMHIINRKYLDKFSNWEIRIAGWDQNGHQKYLEKKVSDYNLNSYISFIGSVFNEQKEKELLNADAFILPSYSEGLPMTILEAWAYQLPVLMTEECNLSDGFMSEAAIKLNLNSENIAGNLVSFFDMSDSERNKIGKNGYELVKEKYTWEKIAESTKSMYEWLLNEKDTPDFIKID